MWGSFSVVEPRPLDLFLPKIGYKACPIHVVARLYSSIHISIDNSIDSSIDNSIDSSIDNL